MGDVVVSDLTNIELLNLLDRVSAQLRRRQVAGDNQDTYSTTSFEPVDFEKPDSQRPVPSRPLLTPWSCGYSCRWCSQACTRKEGHSHHSCYEHRHRR